MTTWQEFTEELDAWAAAGRRATMWWRDDDAAEPSEPLDRLIALATDYRLPIALAVIPGRCGMALAERLDTVSLVTPVQHGYLHRNHAPAGHRKVELGHHRPVAAVREELARGMAVMAATFGSRARAVLVPPWDRIDPAVIEFLPDLGFRGLSTHKPRKALEAARGLRQTNAHVDIMRWQAPRGFLGESDILGELCKHLRARRLGRRSEFRVDPGEPTGLLTHHLDHDQAAWAFLERLATVLAEHRGAQMIDVDLAFGLSTLAEPACGP